MVFAESNLPVPVFFLIAAPWDFAGGTSGVDTRGLGEILDRLHGEVGLTGLSIWGAAPAWSEFRPQKAPHLIHCEGGLFFDPLLTRGECRPPDISTVSRRILPEIAATCQKHDTSLRLLLSFARLDGLAQFYPEFASRNAFDDTSRTSVCLLNPAVQDCMKSIACAIPPQFGVRQVVLHDVRVAWWEAFDRNIRWPCPLGPVEQSMLSTCFCACCVSAAAEAGIEADAARTAVTTLMARSLANGTSFGAGESGFLAEHPALAAYRQVQVDQVNGLLREIVESNQREILMARKSAQSPDPLDLRIPAGVITEVPALSEAGDSLCSGAARNEVTIPASSILGPRGEEFVGAMANLPRWGCTGIQIDGFASLPESSWTTLKQAIRFARRSFA